MMRRMFVVVLALAACGKSKDAAPDQPLAATPAVAAKPVPKVVGPSVTPTITQSITFVNPKAAGWWGEMSFACYRAVMALQPGTNPGEAFEKLSPNVPGAMKAGDIDLGTDIAAAGAFECSGQPCIYVALTLRHPEKMIEVVRGMHAGSDPVQVEPDHYTFTTEGTAGPRTVHVRVLPIQWGGKVPDDAWSKESARATHVVFIAGFDGPAGPFDPAALLADAPTALAHVQDAEGVLADAHGRCIEVLVGPHDFQPGFALDRARFALAAPDAQKPDALMTLLTSKRTLDVEAELTLTPAPKESDVTGWIQQGRQALGGIAAPLRAQFAASPLMAVYVDMFSLMGERGFQHTLNGKSVRFSWRTDRVPQSDLEALEKRLATAMGK